MIKPKLLLIFYVVLIALQGCEITKPEYTNLSDKEIESLLIGYWYVPRTELKSKRGTGVSIYSEDHKVVYVAFADLECTILLAITDGTWKVIDNHLILTIGRTTMPKVHSPEGIITDEIISIDNENVVLRSVNNEDFQYRTKINNCNE